MKLHKRKITFHYKPSAIDYKAIADAIYKTLDAGKEKTNKCRKLG